MDEVSLAEMVVPVAGPVAVGDDLRSSGAASELYLTVKDDRTSARSMEREALASGDPDVDPLTAGLRLWTEVQGKGATLLVQHAKDLQVAAWMVEAWTRTDGFAGLADGFTLLAELVDHYWDEGLHPQEDEDGVETRLAPLFGLFGRDDSGSLLQPIKLLPLSDHEHVALWTIEAVRAQAVRHDDPEIREELSARREQRLAELDGRIASASPTFIEDTLDAIERARGELERLMSALESRTPYGRFGSQVATPLEAIHDILRQHRRIDAEAAVVEVEEIAGPGDDVMEANVPAGPRPNGMDRAGALATLLEIAGYFDRTEPQSLIGNSLRDLVRRAKLPLDELMAELIPDHEQRAMFMMRAGIAAPQRGGGGGFDDGIRFS